MKTKLFTLFLAFVASINTLWAYDAQIGNLYYNLNISNKTAQVTYKSYNSSSYAYNAGWSITTANIPSSVTYNGTTYSVTSIGEWAFYGCSALTSVTIPNSVTSIGKSAFAYCIALTSVTIPNSVTSIGNNAFEGCTSLTSVTIPNSVTSIGYYAFFRCTGLTSVTIGNSVTSIGNAAFEGCTALTTVTIPGSVTSIGDGAFSGCSSLTSVTIPNSVTSIGSYAFYNVANIVYSGTATGSPWGARSVNGYVDGYLVYSDASKTSLLACFAAAQGDIVIPSSVTSIGDFAFYNCTALTSITIPNGVTSIERYTFSGCISLTSVNIPNSVTSIEDYAFYHCTGLTSVTIPSSVTSIGENAFSNVPNIVYSGIATGSPWGAKSINGYVDGYLVYSDASKTALLVCSTAAQGDIVIPSSVTSIGSDAFSGCSALTSVTIPNSVTSIGYYAFDGCTGLTSITIPNSVTSIEDYAFYHCTGLTSVTIPSSVRSIGSYAFDGCTGLTSITIPNSVTSIGGLAFYGCTSLTSVTIPNSVTSIGDFAFDGCTSLPVTDNIRYADTYLVEAVDKTLTTYNIKAGTRFIGDAAFHNCTALTSITIPNSVTSIGAGAFSSCSSLTSVTIPNSVTTIENWAFKDCSSLTSIICYAIIPPKCIGYVFSYVDDFITLYVPAGSIEAYKTADEWKDFTNILPISGMSTESAEVKATPSNSNSVSVTWPEVSGATTYTIEIKKNGVLICTLTFNAEGILINKTFAAPARDGARNVASAMQAGNGWTYTVTGLESNTDYTYTVIAKNASGGVLLNQTVGFKTPLPDGIEDVVSDSGAAVKTLYNGQVLIQHAGKTYTLQGQEVK